MEFDKEQKYPVNQMANNKKSDYTFDDVFELKKKKSSFVPIAEFFVKYFQLIAFILVVGLIITIIVVGLNIYKREVTDFKKEISVQQLILLSKQNKLAEISKSEIDYNSLEAESQKIMNALPDKKKIDQLFVDFEKLASDNNLILSSISFSNGVDVVNVKNKPNQETRLKRIDVNMELVGGDYYIWKKFISQLENNLRLIDLDSIMYQPGSDGFSISCRVYYME